MSIQVKNKWIQMRVTESTKEEVRKAAKDANKSICQYIDLFSLFFCFKEAFAKMNLIFGLYGV